LDGRAKPMFANITDERGLSVAVFSLFSAWLLTVPFEGRILYVLADRHEMEPHACVFGAMVACFLGLILSGLIVSSLQTARKVILSATSFCGLGSAVFLMPPSFLWNGFLWASSFLIGLSVSSWGHYLKAYTTPAERTKTVAHGLIYSNLLMILINTVTANVSPYFGLALAVLSLIGAFILGAKLAGSAPPLEAKSAIAPGAKSPPGLISPVKPLLFLCLFIAVITIDSGLMYQVVSPAYAHHVALSSWYWALPYVVALYIMKRVLGGSDNGYALYVALAMMGMAFLAFMTLDRSVGSYLVVDTLILGACGVYDLFWWSTLAEMLEFGPNPAAILGSGLSANVLGVLAGGIIGRTVFRGPGLLEGASALALTVLFLVLAILPRLQKELSLVLKDHEFLVAFTEAMPEASQKEKAEALDKLALIRQLTVREKEVADLLLQGLTYKDIARGLFISENTVKYHVKNIYSKVNVRNKIELMNLLTQKTA
jgi:DNA-binding CsgD family transcriptional regulator